MVKKRNLQKMTLIELQDEEIRAERELKQCLNRKNLLQNQVKALKRNDRTHRLIMRGAMVEHMIPESKELTQDDFSQMMGRIVAQPIVREIINQQVHQSKENIQREAGEES